MCDDANTANNDGCSSTCGVIETNYICTGGSSTNRDTCTACTTGFTPNTAKTSCIPVCGDGLRVAGETCDDGNTSGSDGCSADCLTIETNYVCSGGSTSSIDTCTACTDGFQPNTGKDTCVPI